MVEQTKMTEVLVLEGSLHLKWVIVVVAKVGRNNVILIELSAEVEANHAPDYDGNLTHVPGSTFNEVGVPDGASEEHTSGAGDPLKCLKYKSSSQVVLELWVKLMVLDMPLVVVSQHLEIKRLVHRIVDPLTACKFFTEDVSTHRLGVKHFLPPGFHLFLVKILKL